ncbi:MAG: DEAD/DEAH box helicase, partial [Aeromicrobium sp.]
MTTVAVRDPAAMLERLVASSDVAGDRRDRVTHVEWLPARAATTVEWPGWAPRALVGRWQECGISTPWSHQRAAADLAHAGRSVVIATGTASGKSLAFQLPALSAAMAGSAAPDGRGATVLYLSPTKALAGDQARALGDLAPPGVRIAAYDGDSS